jgi:hypothetical protein
MWGIKLGLMIFATLADPSLPSDKIIWSGTSNGMFSVRSAYYLGLDLLRKQKGECSFRVSSAIFGKNFGLLKFLTPQKNFFGELAKICFLLNKIY